MFLNDAATIFAASFIYMHILLSTAYFPPIAWMGIFVNQPSVLIDLWETYPKQSYRNRCRIATSLGVLDLNLPVKKPNGNQTKSKDILIDYQQKWQQLHWKSIKTAYESAPYFLYYQDDIEEIVFTNHSHLHLLNETAILRISKLLGFENPVYYTADFIKPLTHHSDFRFSIHPKSPQFIPTPKYYQTFDEKTGFLGNLSVLDLLFHLGPEAAIYLSKLKMDI